jgi:hypothetical protein
MNGYDGILLHIPIEFITATEEQRNAVVNGCGNDKWKSFVPDSLFGIKIKLACDIHDWMYFFSDVKETEREKADRIFHENLRRIVKAKGKWYNRHLAYLLVEVYYIAVKRLGSEAFWENKDKDLRAYDKDGM